MLSEAISRSLAPLAELSWLDRIAFEEENHGLPGAFLIESDGFDLQEHSFGSAVELDGNRQSKTCLTAFEGPMQRRAQIEP